MSSLVCCMVVASSSKESVKLLAERHGVDDDQVVALKV